MNRGLLITFEGVEGSGKTTQAQKLVHWLEEKKIPHLFIREPGGTVVGEQLRKILLDTNFQIHPRCEVILFLAARSQVVYEKILPALCAKKVVVADSFYDSTYAYQTYARKMPERLINVFNRFACAGLKPDLTFLVDFDISKRHSRGKINDRMEKEADNYHQKVREGYLRLAQKAKKRIKLLDGEKPIEILNKEIIDCVQKMLNRKGYKP